MKECIQCGQLLQDYEIYCPRCGSREIKNQVTQQRLRPPVAKPQQAGQGQQGQRPPVARPQQVGQGVVSRPPVAKPQQAGQGQQMQRPQTVRPQQNQAQQQGQGKATQNPAPRSQMAKPQVVQTVQSSKDEFDFDDFDADALNNTENAVQEIEQKEERKERKKGLFGKLKKEPKQKKAKVVKEPKQKRPPVSVPMGTEAPVKSNVSPDGINSPIITVKEWIKVLLILLLLPVFRFVYIFLVLKGENRNPTMKNFMKAALIMLLVTYLLLAIFGGTVGVGLIAAMTY